jgi:BirA family biotin operon repressor/biotin-[acetyl-CoA-carboxylase] ligase
MGWPPVLFSAYDRPVNTLDLEAVDRLLRTEAIGRRVTYLDSTGSTMDIAREWAASNAPHGALVIAEEQTAGRGRFGRRWVSPAGLNLYLTLLVRPDAERLGGLAMIASLAVCRAIETATDLAPVIKWPNDVQIGGRKVSGILIESESQGEDVRYALVGPGINVNDPIADPEIAEIATSLAREVGREVSREGVLAAFLNEFEDAYVTPLPEVRAAWRSRLATLGEEVRLTFGGETYEGVAEDVTADGSLTLRLPDGSRRTFEAGEVSLRS